MAADWAADWAAGSKTGSVPAPSTETYVKTIKHVVNILTVPLSLLTGFRRGRIEVTAEFVLVWWSFDIMSQPWNWKRINFPPSLFDEAAARFEAGLFELALESNPDDLEILLALGSAYSRLGEVRKSLEVDLRLVDARPDEPIFHYNLACSYSLVGRLDSAFASLRDAIKLGYDDLEHLTRDRDLDNLKRDGRFHEIVAELEPYFENEG